MSKEQRNRSALSIKEAAETFGLSRATIYRPIEQKKLATLKIGARRLVRFHERYRPCRIDPTISIARFSGESDERLN
jgi:excisionase family DNA binding protein